MRLLLVIDDTIQEFEAAAYKVSVGEYGDYDAVIMIDTMEPSEESSDERLKYEAEGISRPSKDGISLVPFEKRPLVDILSDLEKAELAEHRSDKGISILSTRPLNHKRLQKRFVVHTTKYDINTPNSLESAIKEMVSIEDLKLKGNLLYLVQEPVMIPKANNTFYLQEIVDVYGPQEEVTNDTKEGSAGTEGSGAQQGADG